MLPDLQLNSILCLFNVFDSPPLIDGHGWQRFHLGIKDGFELRLREHGAARPTRDALL